jgi:lipopolysaccharide/colanic/teichoic acid biosynthesis glycosyltransferase
MGEDGARRGTVRPGLTGWAQISGNSALDNADKLALDLWYVDHRSPRLDLVILARTIELILFGETIDDGRIRAARDHIRQARSDAALHE